MSFRLEDGYWKLVHRQADALTELPRQDDANEDDSKASGTPLMTAAGFLGEEG